jgi:lipopolysaccharide export system permease protein
VGQGNRRDVLKTDANACQLVGFDGAVVRDKDSVISNMKTLDHYLARLMLGPFVATLVVSAMLLLLVRLVELTSFVIDEGGSLGTVFRMLGNLAPQYLSLGVPLGLLIATGTVLRTLAMNNELDTMAVSGFTPVRTLAVPLGYASLLAVALTVLVGWVQPTSGYLFDQLRFDLRMGALGTTLKRGEFRSFGSDTVVRVRDFNKATGSLVGVFGYHRDKGDQRIYVTANTGALMRAAQPDTMIARLREGRMIWVSPKMQTLHSLDFKEYDMALKLPPIPNFRSRGDSPREKTLPELWQMKTAASVAPDLHRRASASLWRRGAQLLSLFAIPFLCMGFAVPPRRSDSALGTIAALILFLVFNEVSLYGERAALSGTGDGMWGQMLPLIGFYGVALWACWLKITVPGGDPLRLLRTLADRSGRLVAAVQARLVPMRAREQFA